MLKKILMTVVLLIASLCIYVAMKPADYNIKREVLIHQTPEKIFPYLSSTKKADDWMPWKDSDQNIKITYSGPEEGLGSTSNWESPGRMGTGKAEVIAVEPNQKITTKITYLKPMSFEQVSQFTLTPSQEGTTLTWSVEGKSTFLSRLMCTLTRMDVDKYVGGEFEKGLNKLKSILEHP